jgi:hypothetical protein
LNGPQSFTETGRNVKGTNAWYQVTFDETGSDGYLALSVTSAGNSDRINPLYACNVNPNPPTALPCSAGPTGGSGENFSAPPGELGEILGTLNPNQDKVVKYTFDLSGGTTDQPFTLTLRNSGP